MPGAIINSKGQITLPADVRRALAIGTGDRVEFVEVEPGQFLLMAANRLVTGLKGMFGKAKKVVSIDEMNRAIAKRASAAR